MRRKRERLHALSLLDDLFPVAVVKSLAVYGIFMLLVSTPPSLPTRLLETFLRSALKMDFQKQL